MRYALVTITILLLLSCKEKKQTIKEKQKEIETGTLDTANKYTAEEVGWTTYVPNGWEIQTKEETRKSTERGKKVIEKVMDAEVDASGLQQLLNFNKDKFNSFLSTIEIFTEELAGMSYVENNKKIYDVLRTTYEDQGIKADYAEDSVLIDGLRFYVFKIKIYKPGTKEVLLHQEMYSRLLNGYDFGMTINYNTDENKSLLEQTLYNSRFSKRN